MSNINMQYIGLMQFSFSYVSHVPWPVFEEKLATLGEGQELPKWH